MAALAVTMSAISLPRSWARMGNCNSCHLPLSFQCDSAEAQKEQFSLPALVGQSSQTHPLVHPLCMETSECLPIPNPQPVQGLGCDCCLEQALGELQPAAKQGWKRSSKGVTLVGVQDFPAASVPVSKAAAQAQTHMVHKARCQRWPRGQGDTPLKHPSIVSSSGCP